MSLVWLARLYFFFKGSVTINFKKWFKIKAAGRGRNSIFGRTFTYRKSRFSSKPNNHYYELTGCNGAKDANTPQDDLTKDGWACDAVISPASLFSRTWCSRRGVQSGMKTCLPH
jgi:hypothetical protein